MKSCFSLLIALLFGLTLSAQANSFTTYKVAGTASDGGRLSGSALLDETIGRFVSSDVSLNSYGDNLVFSGAPFYSGPNGSGYFLSAFFGNLSGSYLYIDHPGSSIVNYAGGPVTGSVQLPTNNTSLRTLSLTTEPNAAALAPAPTPEPASLLLLGTGIFALWGMAALFSGRRAGSAAASASA